jgi:hypothetical protein
VSEENTSTSWSLNLDVHDALESLENFHGSLEKVGDVESIKGLIETMTHVGLAVGAVGGAIFAIKETFDLVFDAEKIRMVENQFEVFSEKAGIAGENLKRAMVDAAGGLMSEDELLKSANRGLVELGANAAHMGELMTIARQATLVMGGDLKNNFEGIVQAIASGSTRALKNLGIIVDQRQAFKDYAKSIGVAADELSAVGRQHAILNAVLKSGGEAFKGTNTELAEATNNWAAFKNTMKDVGDIATLAYEKIAGPAVRAEVGGMSAIAKDAKRWFVDMFGGGAEQAAAHTERLKDKIQEVKATLIDLEQKKLGHVFDPNPGDTNSRFAALTAQLHKYEAELGKTADAERKIASQGAATEAKNDKDITHNKEINLELRAKNQLKFEQQLNALREKTLSDQKKQATTAAQIDKINAEQKKIILAQEAADAKKIDQQEGLSEKQKAALRVQLEEQTRLKIKAIDLGAEQDRLDALKAFDEQNKHSADGFVGAWKYAGANAAADLANFAKLGETSINAVNDSFTGAFKSIGDGSKSAGDAMKGALLQALGTIAISEGSMLLLSGIGEFNPVKASAGGALIALGSYLETQAGGAGGGAGTPSVSAGGGGATSSSSYGASSSSPSAPTALQQAPQKTVSLTVAGNYYDSNETKTQLMDMIRQATDATDFNYTKVGGK